MPQTCPEKLFDVKGLVAVVTGGGTGIGLMMAKTLEHHGAIVYISSRRLDILEQAARENNKFGNLIPVQCDVSDLDSVQSLVDTIKARHGYINLLVNNAGVAYNLLPKLPNPETGDIKSLQQVLLQAGSRTEFAHTMEMNVSAQYYCTLLFLELLDAGNKRDNMHGVTSQIITVASGGGFRLDDKVFSVSYTLSKGAAIHLGKLLAHFLKDWQIRSNVIAPGIFPSEMTDELHITEEQIKQVVPLQRRGTEDDIGGMILYLASKAGAYVNGSVQLVDGGRLLLYPANY